MDLHVPGRRLVGAAVVGDDAIQVLDQIRPERREDIDARSDAGIHLLLDQGGMEVPGIERHQSNLSHRAAALLSGEEHAAGDSTRDQSEDSGAHRSISNDVIGIEL